MFWAGLAIGFSVGFLACTLVVAWYLGKASQL